MSTRPNPLVDKSYLFARTIVRCCRQIQKQHKEYVLSKQLISSGTSIGANIEEATQAQSRPDFVSKLSIALKEAHESRYWIRLMKDEGLCEYLVANEMLELLQHIIRLLVSSIKTARQQSGIVH
jgi:four helix bundle protein